MRLMILGHTFGKKYTTTAVVTKVITEDNSAVRMSINMVPGEVICWICFWESEPALQPVNCIAATVSITNTARLLQVISYFGGSSGISSWLPSGLQSLICLCTVFFGVMGFKGSAVTYNPRRMNPDDRVTIPVTIHGARMKDTIV